MSGWVGPGRNAHGRGLQRKTDRHGAAVLAEHVHVGAGRGIPDPDGKVAPARRLPDTRAADALAVSPSVCGALAGGRAEAAAYQVLAVRGDGQRQHLVGVALERSRRVFENRLQDPLLALERQVP